jgi:DNA-binding response OmpR family regulator
MGETMAMPAGERVPRIMVVDDDRTVADVVTRYLEREGYDVTATGDGSVAVELATAAPAPPDLVILDLMLPGLDGLEVCRRLRRIGPIPVIMLTARGDEVDRVIGLELGADDYVAKPFSPRELTARVRSVLRRTAGSPSSDDGEASVLRAGDLRVDLSARDVILADRPVQLTAREFDLLAFLMRHPRRVFRREELLDHVWGYSMGDTATVTVHVRRLREKVEADPSRPVLIQTVWGVGYRFDGRAEGGPVDKRDPAR